LAVLHADLRVGREAELSRQFSASTSATEASGVFQHMQCCWLLL